MTTYMQFQQKFAEDLINEVKSVEIDQQNNNKATDKDKLVVDLKVLVDNLIDSLPYYFDPNMDSAHRGALVNILESQLPNIAIAHQPMESSWGVITEYDYNGSYTGYQNAFYTGIGLNSLGSQVYNAIYAVNPALSTTWWGIYSVAVLTDAVRQKISMSLDSNKLSSALQTSHSAFLPALAASYFTVLKYGYSPTVEAIDAINKTGQTEEASQILFKAISAPAFIANINESISMGGKSTISATWFLYNLWMALKAIGYPDVDAAITQLISDGLNVPAEVQSKTWWNGTYVSWYTALSGADVLAQAGSKITAQMPQKQTVFVQGWPSAQNIMTDNGYSLSLCEWGELSYFKPKSSSCFGPGTKVLMSDGTSKSIELIEIGDQVMTNLGPKQVLMIETPKRAKRDLYRINNLELNVTSGHPFLIYGDDKAKFAAVDSWELIDGIPTFIELGVKQIQKGLALSALKNGQSSVEVVKKVDSIGSDDHDDTECVYDLLLENWEMDRPKYYVGGPDVYLESQAEWIDPSFDFALSLVFITALEISLPNSRRHISNPHEDLRSIVSSIDMDKVQQLAQKTRRPYRGNKKIPITAIPDHRFYMDNGKWDQHASILGYYLVRQHSRRIRSILVSEQRINNNNAGGGDHLALGLFQIEMVNSPLEANEQYSLDCDLIGAKTNSINETINLDLGLKKESRWLVKVDKTVNLGMILSQSDNYFLVVTLKRGEIPIGNLRISLFKHESYNGYSDQTIKDPNGTAIGRLGFDIRKLSHLEIRRESQRRKSIQPDSKLALAYAIGRQLGHELSALIESSSNKELE